MAVTRDYYEVLGVSQDASDREIRSAYRKLARKYHPDVSDEPDAHERFQEIGQAYAVLSDAERRARYDRFGHAGLEGGGVDFGMPDIFELFRTVVGGFGFGEERAPRGSDVAYDLEVTLAEVATGVEREIAVSRFAMCDECGGEGAAPGSVRQKCPTCRGMGRVRYQQRSMFFSFSQEAECPDCRGSGVHIPDPCDGCRGTGRRRRTEKLTVQVPAGVADGQLLRLRGQGDVGPLGAPGGDLYVRVHVAPHETLIRRGMDLVCEAQITYPQAALGDLVQVPGIFEPHELRIPPGVQHGDALTVEGAGLPRMGRERERGDLHVLLRVVVPKRLSKRERELLLSLAEEQGVEVTPQSSGVARKISEALGG
jgi:molecular chaperone DnaJ